MSAIYRMRPWTPLLVSLLGVGVLYLAAGAFAQVSSSSQAGSMPLSDIPPSSETVNGVIGTSNMAMRADARVPRITRATTVVTDSTGSFSGTWSSPLPANPTISLTPVATGASIDCQLTAMPTITTFQGRCYSAQTTTLNLGIVTAGLSLNPVTTTPAGVSVQVIALPPTQ